MSAVPLEPALRDAFVGAMRGAAAAVSIVSTDGAAGRFAQTVSAVCSVSADPPTLLACINRASPVPDALRANGLFGVSLLAAEQQPVAETFAGRPPDGVAPYDFSVADWAMALDGIPVVEGAVAAFVCELERVIEVASHVVLVGRVLCADGAPGAPLTYSSAAYGRHLPHVA